MKKSLSRTSKISEGINDINASLPGIAIPETKWIELIEKEENDLFILQIREEIVQNCLNICYQHYLEQQCIEFTVCCAHKAWTKAISVYYMSKDQSDTDDPELKASWEADQEPEPSVIDSWASRCIKIYNPQEIKKDKVEDKEISSYDKPVTETKLDALESMSFVTYLYEAGEGEYYYPTSFSESESLSPSRRKSIFSLTLSMSKEALPLATSFYTCVPPVPTSQSRKKNTQIRFKDH